MEIFEHKGNSFKHTDGSTIHVTMLSKKTHQKDEVIQNMLDQRRSLGFLDGVEIHYVDNGDAFGVVMIPLGGVLPHS